MGQIFPEVYRPMIAGICRLSFQRLPGVSGSELSAQREGEACRTVLIVVIPVVPGLVRSDRNIRERIPDIDISHVCVKFRRVLVIRSSGTVSSLVMVVLGCLCQAVPGRPAQTVQTGRKRNRQTAVLGDGHRPDCEMIVCPIAVEQFQSGIHSRVCILYGGIRTAVARRMHPFLMDGNGLRLQGIRQTGSFRAFG